MTDQTDIAYALIKRFEKMESHRRLYDNTYQVISEFVLPNREDFTVDRAAGDRRDRRVFDTTAVQANETLAAALHSGLTNPADRWFILRPSDLDAQDDDDIKKWLAEVTNRMFSVFSRAEHGFSQQNHELLLDLVAYGTAAMFVEDDADLGITFQVRHLSEIYIDENNKGLVDTVFRKFKYTARQAIQEWPELLETSRKVKQAVMSDPQKEFTFIHAVMPRVDYERIGSKSSSIGDRFPFASVYTLVEEKIIVSEKGFREMPYLVPRWEKLVGEVYGRSPAWNALADIRMINAMSETMIRAAQKEVDPPLLMADDGVLMPLQTFPSGVNIGGLDENGRQRIQPLVSNTRLDIGLEMMEQRRDAIRKAYFIDQFIEREGVQPLTATESIHRQENRLRLTGPQTRRLEDEYLSKLIDRVFAIMQRRGLFPEPPEGIQGQNIDIEYVSPLANTQRSQQLLKYNKFVAALAPFLQVAPDIVDNFDLDNISRNIAKFSGIELEDVRELDQVAEIRQDREEQQAQQAEAELLQEAANTAATLQKSGIDVTQ